MSYLLILCFFLFGTIVGSFLNVVVLRYGAQGISGARSRCGACGWVLRWFELVPLLSFFAQGGRCRSCKSRISWQYPLVELVTGVVFALVAWRIGLFSFGGGLFSYSVIQLLVIQLTLWSLLIAISVYDLRHKIIPDRLVWSFVVFAFLSATVRAASGGTPLSWGLLVSPVFALLFGGIWLVSRGRLIGLGDAKLLLGFAPLVGGVGAVSAVALGFWIGAFIALAGLLGKRAVRLIPPRFSDLKARLKGLTMKTELPLAPFLVLGLFVVYLFGWDITGLSLLMQGNS